jgi:hypothetical protein
LRTILIIIFTLISTIAFSQRLKYIAKYYSHGEVDKSGIYYNKASAKECNIVVVIDKSRITIYNQLNSQLDLVQRLSEGYDDDKNPMLKYLAVDEEGLRCYVYTTVVRNSDKYSLKIVVEYKSNYYSYLLVDS